MSYFTRLLVSGIESVKGEIKDLRCKGGFSRFVRGPSRVAGLEWDRESMENGICKNFDYILKIYVCTRFLDKSKSMIKVDKIYDIEKFKT